MHSSHNLKFIGKRLKSLRKKNGFTVKELSKKAGVSQSHVSMIENSKTFPSLQTLAILADVLSVEITYFFVSKTSKQLSLLSNQDYQTIINNSDFSLELITTGGMNEAWAFYILRAKGKALLQSVLKSDSRYIIYCIKGEFELRSSYKNYLISEGYSLIMLKFPQNYRLFSLTNDGTCVIFSFKN